LIEGVRTITGHAPHRQSFHQYFPCGHELEHLVASLPRTDRRSPDVAFLVDGETVWKKDMPSARALEKKLAGCICHQIMRIWGERAK